MEPVRIAMADQRRSSAALAGVLEQSFELGAAALPRRFEQHGLDRIVDEDEADRAAVEQAIDEEPRAHGVVFVDRRFDEDALRTEAVPIEVVDVDVAPGLVARVQPGTALLEADVEDAHRWAAGIK